MGPRSMGKLRFAFSSVAEGNRCSACSTYVQLGSPCSQGVFTRKTDARNSDLYSLLGACMYRTRYQVCFSLFSFFILRRMGRLKIKLELPHFHVCIRYMSCFYSTHAPVATAARAAATGLVSMSTRPDIPGMLRLEREARDWSTYNGYSYRIILLLLLYLCCSPAHPHFPSQFRRRRLQDFFYL